MRPASSPQHTSTTPRQAGRHRTPTRPHRTIKTIAAAAPALALVGAFVAYQAQPPPPDPVASSMAAYHQHALPPDSVLAARAGAPLTTHPASTAPHTTTRTTGTTTTPRKPATATRARHATSTAKTPPPAPAHSAAPTPSHSPAAAKSLACTGVGGTGMLPQNYAAIVDFLAAHGYTAMAAAGIAGNMYQESGGNPESVGSGGGGLIGFTPLPAGYVTGNVSADLQTQLEAVLSYNQQWAQYIPMLNAATSPTDAAFIYMTYFERPGLPAAANREGAAVAVAQACGITAR